MTSQPPPSGPSGEPSQGPPSGPPSGPPTGPLAGQPSGGGAAGPPTAVPPPSGPPGASGTSGAGGAGTGGAGGASGPGGPGGPSSGGPGRGARRPWWRSGKGLALAAGTVAVAAVAVAAVLIAGNQGGHSPTVPTANEVALQAPADPGPDPFTPSVETQGVSAPAPTPVTPTAQQPGGTSPRSGTPATLHSVEGSSAGLYAGTMSSPSCDTERLVGMVSTGETGRAWASAAGIAPIDVPGYLRSLTSVYLRVDTRVTNHGYRSGAVVEYQSVLEAGTAVLVDAQGVPRVRCSCGNPLKPPTPVHDARYTGQAWAGFQPDALIVVVPAPQPVTEIVLVDIRTGGWFARLTGRAQVVDRTVEPPQGPLAPGIPPPGPWMPATPSAATPTSPGTTSPGTATSPGATSPGATASGATPSGATPSTASGNPPGTATTTTTPPTATPTSAPATAPPVHPPTGTTATGPTTTTAVTTTAGPPATGPATHTTAQGPTTTTATSS